MSKSERERITLQTQHMYAMDARIDKLLTECEKLKNIIRHLLPEKSGHYFIFGDGGNKDANGLPDLIFICPAYGSDVTEIYEKKSK
jgi:hypothetical protein